MEEDKDRKAARVMNGATTASHGGCVPMATSPPYPPVPMGYVHDGGMIAYDGSGVGLVGAGGGEHHYAYPVRPYYGGYQSYPGSPAMHPQSPPSHPTSPPFSPYLQAWSPPTYIVHPNLSFPPLHISSPILSGASSPTSPPQYHLPGPLHKTEFHTRNLYVRGLSENVTDDAFLALCKQYVLHEPLFLPE